MDSDLTGILEIIAGAVGLLTLMLGVLTLVFDHRRRRRQATLEAYLQAGEYRRKLADAAKGTEHSDGEALSLEESYALSAEQSRRRDDLKQYLSFWEHLAVGVRFGVFDRKILKKISGRHLSKLYERYGSYIYFTRRRAGYPEYYSTLEKLAKSFGAGFPEKEFESFWKRKESEESANPN